MQAFPDLEANVRWVVAENDMVVAFYSMRGTQRGPWLFVQEPTGTVVETAFLLAFRFDGAGQIIDQCSDRTSSRCSFSWVGTLPRSAKSPHSRTEQESLPSHTLTAAMRASICARDRGCVDGQERALCATCVASRRVGFESSELRRVAPRLERHHRPPADGDRAGCIGRRGSSHHSSGQRTLPSTRCSLRWSQLSRVLDV